MQNKQHYKELFSNWIKEEKQRVSSDEARERYLSNHRKRFDYILRLCQEVKPDRSTKVLDVGRSHLSIMLSKYYSNVKTLGLDLKLDEGGHRERVESDVEHIIFDLNECKNIEKWIDQKFDLIVYSEVIEHIYEAPEFSLSFFHYLLNKNGYLICTTPNAASLYRREKLLRGENTFSKIRFHSMNPAHYREYTKKELIQMAEMCEFQVIKHEYINFSKKDDSIKDRIYNILTGLIPSFKASQVMILRKHED